KDYFTNVIIIFKDHPVSITTLSIILSFDALQSNWTGIIIDSFFFVKGLSLKFGLNFWIYPLIKLLLSFYWLLSVF
ncbi:hypothetical protein CKA56_15290, partial [Arcobacter venerupis]|uniref:hypothetical protein n=1 Tax=Arcobacter venerupis TaxID=1054033 RepID=UPI0010069A1D